MDVNISAQKNIEIPTAAKEFIYEKLNDLLLLKKNIISCRVKIEEVKGIFQCQIRIIPANDKAIIVKSNGLSIKTSFLDAYNKVEFLINKIKDKKLTKKQKSNLV